MPKIPMLNQSAVNHQSSTVHMTGAPGMNFKMDESRALINFGNTLSDFGGTIANAGNKTVSAKVKFLQQQQYTEDRLAAAEARNLYRNLYSQLDARMTENPAEFAKFKEWAEETDKTFGEQLKPIADRMSPQYRKEFDAEMAGMRSEGLNRRIKIGTQAKITADYNLFQSQWKDAALRADLDECNRLLEEHRGRLISEQEYQQKKLDYNRMAEFSSVKKMIEANSPRVLELLQERADAGYKNFVSLDENSRNQLIRFAKAKDAEIAAEFTQNYITQINSGTLTDTVDDLKKQFAEGKISRSQFNAAMPYVKKYHEDLKRTKTQETQQELRLKQLRTEDAAGAFVYNTLYASDGSKRSLAAEQLAAKRLELYNLCGGSVSLLEKYLPKLNSAASADQKNDFWKTPDGGIIDKWITAIGKDRYAYRWDPDGWEDSEDWSEEQQMAHHLRMNLQYRELAEVLYAKYGDTKDVMDTLSWARKQLNDGTVSSFLEWREKNLSAIDKKLGIPIGKSNSNYRKTGR